MRGTPSSHARQETAVDALKKKQHGRVIGVIGLAGKQITVNVTR